MRTVTVIPIRETASSDREPTLEEILSDPIVTAVMRADRVDSTKLGAMLRRISNELQIRSDLSPFQARAERGSPFVCGEAGPPTS